MTIAGRDGRLSGEPAALPGDVADWLTEMQRCVRERDFASARALFADEVLGFGTRAVRAVGLDALERRQWRPIWEATSGFRFDVGGARVVEADELACVALTWSSLGTTVEGRRFERRGRATLVLSRGGPRPLCIHSHFSLVPGARE